MYLYSIANINDGNTKTNAPLLDVANAISRYRKRYHRHAMHLALMEKIAAMDAVDIFTKAFDSERNTMRISTARLQMEKDKAIALFEFFIAITKWCAGWCAGTLACYHIINYFFGAQ